MNTRKRKKSNWELKGAFDIQELPQVLVLDILSRLSIKALYSCRSVCKDWLHIIHGSEFARIQLRRPPISILIKTSQRARAQRKLDLIQIAAGSGMRVERMRLSPMNVLPVHPVAAVELINSSNGLLCIRQCMNYRFLYVCNPILGEYIRIPDYNSLVDFVALGFSTRNNEYKILQTSYYSDYDFELDAMIYTIGKSKVWRSIGKRPRSCRGGRIPFNSFLHGGIHWISDQDNPPSSIQCFDFEREEFRQLQLPLLNKYNGLRLGVLKGSLYLCVFEGDDRKCDLWVMKNYGVQQSWTKFCVIEHMYPSALNMYEPVMFLSDVEILMASDKFVLSYNLVTKRLEKTRILRTRSQFLAFGYYPCFVSLHDVANGEKVQRIRDNDKFESLLSEGRNVYADLINSSFIESLEAKCFPIC
ncbi:hypothetical protein ACLB2K_034945 [Fragaria x ananassa]